MPKKDRKQQPEEPMSFLAMANDEMEAEIIISLLDSFSIPAVKQYAGMSGLMTIYLGGGNSMGGIEIFVPEAMLQQAEEVLANNTETLEEDEGGEGDEDE